MTYQAGTFSSLNWEQRHVHLGDDAERAFELWAPFPVVRFGLQRPPFRLDRLPPKLTQTPDYICEHGLIEVTAVGRDQTLKVRTSKLDALNLWQQDVASALFIWNWLHRLGALVSVPQLTDQVTDHATPAVFAGDGRPYWSLDIRKLSANWTPPGQTTPPSSTTRFTGTPTATAPNAGH